MTMIKARAQIRMTWAVELSCMLICDVSVYCTIIMYWLLAILFFVHEQMLFLNRKCKHRSRIYAYIYYHEKGARSHPYDVSSRSREALEHEHSSTTSTRALTNTLALELSSTSTRAREHEHESTRAREHENTSSRAFEHEHDTSAARTRSPEHSSITSNRALEYSSTRARARRAFEHQHSSTTNARALEHSSTHQHSSTRTRAREREHSGTSTSTRTWALEHHGQSCTRALEHEHDEHLTTNTRARRTLEHSSTSTTSTWATTLERDEHDEHSSTRALEHSSTHQRSSARTRARAREHSGTRTSTRTWALEHHGQSCTRALEHSSTCTTNTWPPTLEHDEHSSTRALTNTRGLEHVDEHEDTAARTRALEHEHEGWAGIHSARRHQNPAQHAYPVGHSFNLYVGLRGPGWLCVLGMLPRADVPLSTPRARATDLGRAPILRIGSGRAPCVSRRREHVERPAARGEKNAEGWKKHIYICIRAFSHHNYSPLCLFGIQYAGHPLCWWAITCGLLRGWRDVVALNNVDWGNGHDVVLARFDLFLSLQHVYWKYLSYTLNSRQNRIEQVDFFHRSRKYCRHFPVCLWLKIETSIK